MANPTPPVMGPGRRVVFRPNHSLEDGVGGLLRSSQMRDVTERVAIAIARRAAELTPRSDGPGPHMADQYKVIREAGLLTVGERYRNPRVMVRIDNLSGHAAAVEFGGSRNKERRPLRTAGLEYGDLAGKEE